MVHAVDYLETLENLSVRDSSEVQRKELDEIKEVQEFDWRDHEDVQYFDFSNENDSGICLTQHHNGKKSLLGGKIMMI